MTTNQFFRRGAFNVKVFQIRIRIQHKGQCGSVADPDPNPYSGFKNLQQQEKFFFARIANIPRPP
jgi:hypothetical protein